VKATGAAQSAREKFTLEFPSDPLFMSSVRHFVSQLSTTVGFDKNVSYAITLAVDEACTNIIKYSYNNDTTKRIILSIELIERGLRFDIIDFGAKTDSDVYVPKEIEEVAPGGLGVYLITKIMDMVTYDPSDDNSTKLTLVKYLPDEKGG